MFRRSTMMLPWARPSCNQSSQMQTELRSLSRASPGLSIICFALLRWRDPGRRSRSSRLALTAAPSSLIQWRRRLQVFINWCIRSGKVSGLAFSTFGRLSCAFVAPYTSGLLQKNPVYSASMKPVCLAAGILLACLASSVQGDSPVVFNEIMYHPLTNEAQFEWVELQNQMSVDVDISHWLLDGGIHFTIVVGSIIRGGE